MFDSDTGLHRVWPVGKGAAQTPPQALEMVLSVGRFEQVRRVLPLPQGAP